MASWVPFTARRCIWSWWNWICVSNIAVDVLPAGICKKLLFCLSHLSELHTIIWENKKQNFDHISEINLKTMFVWISPTVYTSYEGWNSVVCLFFTSMYSTLKSSLGYDLPVILEISLPFSLMSMHKKTMSSDSFPHQPKQIQGIEQGIHHIRQLWNLVLTARCPNIMLYKMNY